MNDLDLRAALHRDADLVGEPSPDLLDQLVDRRRHQQRRRTTGLVAAAAVVVLAAGIPVGTSFLTRSDGAPATQTTIAPTPSGTDDTPETSPVPTTPADPSPTDPETDTPASPSDGNGAPSAEWPPAAEAVQGGQYWAVFLAVAHSGTEQAELQAAYADATALGYPAGIGEMCSSGAHEQLGLDPTVAYEVVNIYFDTQEQAQQFVDLYEPGVVGTAYVTAYCLD
jgi:hypothetical protein